LATETSSPVRRPRRWIWYFIILLVLTVVAVSVEVGYNLSHQLKLDQVETAHALWDANRPRDYRLQWTRKGSSTETYIVWVRDGRVKAAVMLQGDEKDEKKGLRLEPRLYESNDMSALFDFIEDFLRQDTQPNSPRAFNRATFDATDGHVVHFVRSVMGKGQRVEITDVKIERQAPATPLPRFLWEQPVAKPEKPSS
jgi:hypothetical protein